VLEGSLGDFSLPDIFQLIALTKKTGALTVRSGEHEGRVLFRGGEVTFAVADVRRVALGARLVAVGLVPEEQVTRVLERKRDQGGDVLGLLLDEAVLDEEGVDAFLRGQIEDAVFDLMRLEAATFSFDTVDGEADAVGLTVRTEQLIAEGGRRMEEWSAIRTQIPGAGVVLVVSPAPPTEGERVAVGLAEWSLLALVDGRRTVRDIVELTGKGEFTTCKLLADLVQRGFVRTADADAEGGPLAGMVARREMLRRLEELELGEPVARPEPAVDDTAAPDLPAAPPAEPSGAEPPSADTGVAPAEELPAAPQPQAPADPEATSQHGLNGKDHPAAEQQARPLTRDEDVNKGLLLRLIDGVKEA
jgi:hypothetical protein